VTILWVAQGDGRNTCPTGFEARAVHDIGEARAALESGAIDVVVLDLETAGDVLCDLLPGSRERAEGQPPFVVLCPALESDLEPQEEAALWERGAFDVLQGAPARSLSLGATLRRALHHGRAARGLRRERALLASVLGHDLKNPLSAVLMTAHVLQNRLPEKDRPPLDRIRRASHRLDRMIQDVVDFIHLRQGTPLSLRFDACDLGRLCRNAVDELTRIQPGHQVVFENERPVLGTWDGERLEQLLFHVLSHGMVSGLAANGAVIRLDTELDGEVTVTVHSRGPALSAAELASVFDPLAIEPGHAAARPRMGLYIARAIAGAHGGELKMGRAGEEGTEVKLRLPRTEPPPPLA